MKLLIGTLQIKEAIISSLKSHWLESAIARYCGDEYAADSEMMAGMALLSLIDELNIGDGSKVQQAEAKEYVERNLEDELWRRGFKVTKAA